MTFFKINFAFGANEIRFNLYDLSCFGMATKKKRNAQECNMYLEMKKKSLIVTCGFHPYVLTSPIYMHTLEK